MTDPAIEQPYYLNQKDFLDDIDIDEISKTDHSTDRVFITDVKTTEYINTKIESVVIVSLIKYMPGKLHLKYYKMSSILASPDCSIDESDVYYTVTMNETELDFELKTILSMSKEIKYEELYTYISTTRMYS